MAEQRHQGRDPTQLPSLGLHGVVHVAQVLQVRRRIRLKGGDGWVKVVGDEDDQDDEGVTLMTELGFWRNSMTSWRSGSLHWTPGMPDIPGEEIQD